MLKFPRMAGMRGHKNKTAPGAVCGGAVANRFYIYQMQLAKSEKILKRLFLSALANARGTRSFRVEMPDCCRTEAA
jgi:hypothetical protein